LFVTFLWLVGLAITGTATWLGLPYYLTPLDERPFSALHELYAPTGLIGHGFGIIGSLLVVVGVVLYTARKRVRFLARFGKLRDWLHFHIFLCLVGPYLVLLHTTFKFGGFVAISFWSMAAVVGSGVFGRYVYSWIPKTISGGFVGAEEIRERMEALLVQAQASAGLSADRLRQILRPSPALAEGPSTAPPPPPSPPTKPTTTAADVSSASGMARSVQALFDKAASQQPATAEPPRSRPHAPATAERRKRPRPGSDRRKRVRQPGMLRAIGEAMTFRFTRRRRRARYDRELSAAGVTREIRSKLVQHLDEESQIEQQLRVLQPFQRAFRYWHAFHLPLAAVMFIVLFGHVAVAIMFGYTWIF
jgi:hypothetical protein